MTRFSHPPDLDRWEEVAFRWELNADERAALLGVHNAGCATDIASYCAPSTGGRLELLLSLDAVLTAFFHDEGHTRAWLRRENAGLGGKVPIDVMASSPEWIRWLVGVMETAS